MFLVLVLMPSQPLLPSSHRYRCCFLFLDFVLMRNRKKHPNNNYLGNMTFKSACPGIKHGRHLHSLKIVEIFHIELIWNIRAFTTGLSCLSLCLGIGSLPPSVFLSLFPSVSTGIRLLLCHLILWIPRFWLGLWRSVSLFLGSCVFSAVAGPHL